MSTDTWTNMRPNKWQEQIHVQINDKNNYTSRYMSRNLNKYQTSAESASHIILTYQYIISSLTIESEFEPTQKQYAKYNKLMENGN